VANSNISELNDPVVNNLFTKALNASRHIPAAEIIGGRRVSVRIEENTLTFFDPETRELLPTRPNPLTWDQARRLRGARSFCSSAIRLRAATSSAWSYWSCRHLAAVNQLRPPGINRYPGHTQPARPSSRQIQDFRRNSAG
jgi:hypothetical protein